MAERQSEREQEENAGGAGESGNEADGGFVEGGEGLLAAQPRDGHGEVVERGAVVVARIEGVAAVFDEFAGFDGLVRLVGVHRAVREIVRAQPKCGERDKREGEPTTHGSEHGRKLVGRNGWAQERADFRPPFL
jgi:hypothetical protein